MAKSKPPAGKRARRELARKKYKRNRMITIAVIVVVALAAAALTYTIIQNSIADVYANGDSTVRLRPDGRFKAALHDVQHKGAYTRAEEDGVTAITFTYGKETAIGELFGDQLFIPAEWDDGDGHSMVLIKE